MKKFVLFVLAISMVVILAACSEKSEPKKDTDNNGNSQQVDDSNNSKDDNNSNQEDDSSNSKEDDNSGQADDSTNSKEDDNSDQADNSNEDLVVFKDEQNKYQVSAASDWQDANGELHDESDFQIYNLRKEKYFMALMESKEDFDDFSLQEYFDIVTDSFLDSLDKVEQGDVKEVTINGNKGLQYTVDASIDNLKIVYFVTIIETPTDYGQLITWTLKSKWDEHKDEYNDIINSFKSVE